MHWHVAERMEEGELADLAFLGKDYLDVLVEYGTGEEDGDDDYYNENIILSNNFNSVQIKNVSSSLPF